MADDNTPSPNQTALAQEVQEGKREITASQPIPADAKQDAAKAAARLSYVGEGKDLPNSELQSPNATPSAGKPDASAPAQGRNLGSPDTDPSMER